MIIRKMDANPVGHERVGDTWIAVHAKEGVAEYLVKPIE